MSNKQINIDEKDVQPRPHVLQIVFPLRHLDLPVIQFENFGTVTVLGTDDFRDL